MRNKQSIINLCALAAMMFAAPAFAEDAVVATADAYQPDGSVFQQIAELEQNRILMQLEKEKAQMELDLDRIAAERIRLQLEVDSMSGNLAGEAEALEQERQRLAAERDKLDQERRAAREAPAQQPAAPAQAARPEGQFKLIEIVGSGPQLQATLENSATRQRRRIVAGQEVDGWTVRFISFAEGVGLEKDGDVTIIGISG